MPDVKEYIEIYEDIINESPFTEKGMSVVFSEADLLKRMKDHLEKNEWDEMQRLVSAYTFETSPRCNKADRTMMKYKIFRNELKGYLSRPIFSMSGEILRSDLAQVKGGVFSLIDTTLEYISRVNAEMKRKNAYSFDAIAHMALSLTVKRDENGIAEKTDYAKELSG